MRSSSSREGYREFSTQQENRLQTTLGNKWSPQMPRKPRKRTKPRIASSPGAASEKENGSEQKTEAEPHSDIASHNTQDSEELATILETELPAWFLENCVQTYEEISASKIPLMIKDAEVCNEKLGGVQKSRADCDGYEMDSLLYGSLTSLLPAAIPGLSSVGVDKSQSFIFAYDAAIFRVPVHSDKESGVAFLAAVVRNFAKDQGTDVITLHKEDIAELWHFFFPPQVASEAEQPINRGSKDSDGDDSDAGNQSINSGDNLHFKRTHRLLFTKILAAVDAKLAKQSDGGARPQKRCLIVELPDLQGFCYADCSDDLLIQLQEAVKEANSSQTKIIVIGLDSWESPARRNLYRDNMADFLDDSIPSSDYQNRYAQTESKSLLSLLGSNPLRPALPLLPRHTDVQCALFESHGIHIQQTHNIRALKWKIRRCMDSNETHKLLEPYAIWEIPENSQCFRMLSESRMEPATLDIAALAISVDVSMDHILKVFQSLNDVQDRMEPQNKPEKSRFSGFDLETQEAIANITQDTYKYPWENQLLDQIVSPEEVEYGWAAIELEDQVKQVITQLLNLAISDPGSQSGILRHSRINGALLYGPPGTGKTHLARVLAHEYKAVVIHVSAAELENKYVGETEKAIKALFNLATMIYPSIIFIDEADSLFRKRQPHDQDWTRSRLNTLLAQTDGLIKSKRQPFLLISTNHPGDLDEAVLRRVPARLYIGLPSTSARLNMLGIFLREEELDPDLRLNDVAARTAGFTGSDLQTLCVQTALISQAETRQNGQKQTRRVLKYSHFEKGLTRCGPTVSDSALRAIRNFADKFDPSAVSRIGLSREDTLRGSANSTGAQASRKRGLAGQDVPSILKDIRPSVSGDNVKSFDEWKKSDMYPYVTEEVCQKWWNGGGE
ncbi:putative spastin like protein spas-1 [Paramyrothecium foliicola]|nr:putative spastin like protein spas-1 [Paramyrothecium foliicola]